MGAAESPRRASPLYWRLGMAPDGKQIALRDGDWKILADDALESFELYDLRSDPKESRDLSKSDPERFEAMKKRLLAFNANVEAEGPDWWKRLSVSGGMPPKKK
jgi:hypothetical protein